MPGALEKRFCALWWGFPHIYNLNLYSAHRGSKRLLYRYVHIHIWSCKYVVLCINKTRLFLIFHCRVSCHRSLRLDVRCRCQKSSRTGFRITFFSRSKNRLNWRWLKSKVG